MSDRLTLGDYVRSEDPNGAQAQIVEILEQELPIIQDAYAKPSNADLGNRTTIRSSLPTVGTVKINQGVTKSRALTRQVTDAIGLYEGRSETDTRIARLLGMGAFETRRRQDMRQFSEALSQRVATDMVYGSIAIDEASFDGLVPRMASLSTARTGSQVWSMGSVVGSDGCSLLIVDWGDGKASVVFPKNSKGGISVEDKGEQEVLDDEGKPYFAYVSLINWAIGICVEDPRHIARLSNIDLSDSLLSTPTQGWLIRTLTQTMDMMPQPGGAQRVLYCPIRLYSAFRLQAMEKSNLALTLEQYLGKMEPHFMGYPIRKLEVMTTSETTVS
jgi:hypothetical protein